MEVGFDSLFWCGFWDSDIEHWPIFTREKVLLPAYGSFISCMNCK